MACCQFCGIRLFIFCVGLMFFLPNDSVAMMEEYVDPNVTELVPTSGSSGVIGKLQEIDGMVQQAEKRIFSSLVYRIGSTGGDVSEIEIYCAGKISYYSGLANSEVTSPYTEISKNWLAHQNKALVDIAALKDFYQKSDDLIFHRDEKPNTPNSDIKKTKAQKLQADALFHYFYPFYNSGKGKYLGSVTRKIWRYKEGSVFCRPEPDFTVPDKENGEDFYNFHNTLVPRDMQVTRQINSVDTQSTGVIREKRILRSPTDEALKDKETA